MPNLVPVSDEQAKAVTALAGLGSQVVRLVEPLLRPVAEIVGRATTDTIGLLGADWLTVARLERIAELQHNSAERLRKRGVEPQPVSPTLAIPLLKAAADEDNAELLDLWEALLAAAMDPTRARAARRSFVELLRRMDPVDAVAFKILLRPGQKTPTARDYIATAANARPDEIEVAFANLFELGCIIVPGNLPGRMPNAIVDPQPSAIGRELGRVLGLS